MASGSTQKLVPGFGLGRDPERTPMRWDRTPKGGFSGGEAWLPMNDDSSCNVEQQAGNQRSILELYRALIELRRHKRCLVDGAYRPFRARNDVLSCERLLTEDAISVGLNISGEPRLWNCEACGELLMSTYLDRDHEAVMGPILLRGNEGIIVQH